MIYNERLPTTEGLRAARSPGESWIPQGRDALLEEWLLDKIVKHFEERAALTSAPADGTSDAESQPATGGT
jgi:hypothetical protein